MYAIRSYYVPQGISAEVEKQTKVTIRGIDKELVGATAAKIRSFRGPEPYKGKGIKYSDERIVRKAGRITSYNVCYTKLLRTGGGHKRKFRLIDFKRDKKQIPAKVVSVEYDPNRSARIALLSYADGEKRYILSPVGLTVGDVVLASDQADIKPGNALTIRAIPLGTWVHNVSYNFV